MLIIAISGKAEHGKDASAIFMKQLLNKEGKRVLVTHYGDVLKFICTNYFGWNGEKDEAGRTLLQHVGTDLIRAKDPEFLVDFMTSTLRFFEGLWDYVIIPDIRVPNEISKLMEAGFKVTHVRVYRPGYTSTLSADQSRHYTETAMDTIEPDFMLVNDGDLVHLGKVVESWMRAAHLLH